LSGGGFLGSNRSFRRVAQVAFAAPNVLLRHHHRGVAELLLCAARIGRFGLVGARLGAQVAELNGEDLGAQAAALGGLRGGSAGLAEALDQRLVTPQCQATCRVP